MMFFKKVAVSFFSALFSMIALCLTAAPAFADFGPLVSANELEAILGQDKQPLVLDIRSGTVDDGQQPIFDAGHIPGSISAPYGLFRGPKDNPGQLITEGDLEALLQSLGVSKDRQIVVVYQGKNASDFGSAARVYWTLKSSGLNELAILNGGINAWSKAGFSLEKGQGAGYFASDIDITFSPRWLATTDDVKEVVAQRDLAYDLIDARTEDFWQGKRKHPAALKPGTLPQSRYFSQSRWFSPKNNVSLIDEASVEALIQEGDFRNKGTLISFCNTGHWAATNWFVLSELGELEDVRLYAGSLVEYSHAGGKMANTPGLFSNLLRTLTGN